MSKLEIENGYPLRWPDGRPRTLDRKSALFRSEGRPLTLSVARARLREQLGALTPYGKPWRTTGVILSINIRFTASGSRDMNVSRRDPEDPGAALYFDFDRRPHVLACDRWDTVGDNIAAIAAHIEALRGQERWGVADLRQAFAGHMALPAPDKIPPLPWRKHIGLPEGPVTREALDAAYRREARFAHPDAPHGSRQAWDKLTAHYEAAKRELGL